MLMKDFRDLQAKTGTTREELQTQLYRFDSIVTDSGYDPETKETISMKDAVDLPNAAFLIPRVLSQFVQEGIEPLLIGTTLLHRIDYVEGMQTVFPAIDVLTAREVGDGMALPIFNIHIGGSQTAGVTVKRHGLALRVNEKFIQRSTFPWVRFWLRLAGQALARHKEEMIFSFITDLGTVIFDNSVAARTDGAAVQPLLGATTGRNTEGTYNGSMTADDIFDMYAQVLMQGFIPDTLLVHPLTWLQFIKDPVMREFAIQSGGGSFFANFTGNASAKANEFFNFQGLGLGQGQVAPSTAGVPDPSGANIIENQPQNATSGPVLPGYLGLPFKILVSPFVRFDPITRETDMMMFNSQNLGALIVSEDPHVNSFTEHLYSVQNIGIEESYGFGILNEGQAIAVAKNVKIRPNEIVLPASTMVNVSDATFQVKGDITEFGASPTDINA